MQQVQDREAGDQEAHFMDADYIEAWSTACRRRPGRGSAWTAWRCC